MLFYVNRCADFRQISRKQFLFSIFIEFINCRPHNLLKYLLKIKVLPCIILLRSLIINDFIQTPCFAKIPQNILCMLYMKITIMYEKNLAVIKNIYICFTQKQIALSVGWRCKSQIQKSYSLIYLSVNLYLSVNYQIIYIHIIHK